MPKITFMGAGSTVFAKNVLGDSMLCEALSSSDIALYDIDRTRLRESKRMLDTLNKNVNKGRAKIKAYLGVENRRKALDGADFVVNAIQVGGYYLQWVCLSLFAASFPLHLSYRARSAPSAKRKKCIQIEDKIH